MTSRPLVIWVLLRNVPNPYDAVSSAGRNPPVVTSKVNRQNRPIVTVQRRKSFFARSRVPDTDCAVFRTRREESARRRRVSYRADGTKMTSKQHDSAAAMVSDTERIDGNQASAVPRKLLVDKQVLIRKWDGGEVNMGCAQFNRFARGGNKAAGVV